MHDHKLDSDCEVSRYVELLRLLFWDLEIDYGQHYLQTSQDMVIDAEPLEQRQVCEDVVSILVDR